MAPGGWEHRTRFDVGAPTGLTENCTIAASVFAPTSTPNGAIAVLTPGGSYTRAYYDLHVAGRPGYSAAELLTQAGVTAIAIDNLGTGESSRPADGRNVTLAAMAHALTAAAWHCRSRARRGDLHPDLPPIAAPRLVGIGHSIGGAVTMLAQANLAPFAGVAILGMTTGIMKHSRRDADGAIWTPEECDEPGYIRVPRQELRAWFHAADVPGDVLAADETTQTVLPMGALEIADAPALLADAAAMIRTPVLLAFGALDVSHDPDAEPRAYSACSEVELVKLAKAGHCHNMSSARGLLWASINDWIARQLERQA